MAECVHWFSRSQGLYRYFVFPPKYVWTWLVEKECRTVWSKFL